MKDIRIYYCRNCVEGNVVPAELADLGMRDDVALEAVPCGGRIDPRYLLKAFESGACAVCVLTCPVGECRLMEGNLRAARRVELTREYLAEAGIEPGAVEMIVPRDNTQAAFDSAINAVVRFVESQDPVLQRVVA
jgi:F420-non-reducing hydrogenase iron-sulfur subunit